MIKRSEYGNGCDFKLEIVDFQGNNIVIPTKGFCFIKGIKNLTGKHYRQQYTEFLRNENRRSFVMTVARIQPFF